MYQRYTNFLFNEIGVGPAEMKRRPHVKTVQFLVFRALLLITCLTACLYFLYGQERQPFVPIPGNAAWNDLVRQIDPSVHNSVHETLGTEVVLIEKFLQDHQTEVNVHVYDLAVFKAIDQVRARLQQADKDLETIRNELSYKEYQARSGR